MPAQPVTKSEFASLMADLGPFGPDEAKSPMALAVSGGGDSMALAFLARSWRTHIMAFIVDHALRSESRQEALLTGQRLSQMGVPYRILTLEKLKSGGLQEQAREARFAVLEQACQEIGASFLLLAHHQADQEETLWMRKEKKSGLEGMVGIAPRVSRRQLTLIRPFLPLRPERLKETLRQAGVKWCEDPSNQNRRFKRVQVRQDLTENDRDLLRAEQSESIQRFQKMESHISRMLDGNMREHPEGWVSFSPHLLTDLAPDLSCFLLGRLIRRVGGESYLPSREALNRLVRKNEGSLGGVILRKRFSKDKIKDFILYREFRNLGMFCRARNGILWDRRWLYQGPDVPDRQIGALAEYASVIKTGRDIPTDVLKTVPALWHKNKLVALPDIVRGVSPEIARAPFLWQGGMKIVGAKIFY